MKKLNPFAYYQLAVKVHALTELPTVDVPLSEVIIRLLWASHQLNPDLAEQGILPPSSQRAAGVLFEAINEVSDFKSGGIWALAQEGATVDGWKLSRIQDLVKSFENVLASDLPGLDAYLVSPKGIYSTSALAEEADAALTSGLPPGSHVEISDDERRDFQQAGRCLAFELPTASAFHAMRATESIVKRYWRKALKKPAEQKCPSLADCIKDLRDAEEDAKVLDVLDHARDLTRNPVMHPGAFLEMHEAFRAFDIAKSAICAVATRLKELTGQLDLPGMEVPSLPSPRPQGEDDSDQ